MPISDVALVQTYLMMLPKSRNAVKYNQPVIGQMQGSRLPIIIGGNGIVTPWSHVGL